MKLLFLIILFLLNTLQYASSVTLGRNANIRDFPSLVSLQVFRNNAFYHFCAGTIIGDNVVLTAAHCVLAFDLKKEVVIVVAGITYLDEDYSGPDVEVFNIIETITHEQYTGDVGPYDIAIIELDRNVTISETRNIAKIDTTGKFCGGVAPGWGSDAALTNVISSSVTNELQQISLHNVDVSVCNNAYRLLGMNVDEERNICAVGGIPIGGINLITACPFYINNLGSVCNGDSGGPIVVDGTVVGTVSWGVPVCTTTPAVFTRVFAYKDWIFRSTGN